MRGVVKCTKTHISRMWGPASTTVAEHEHRSGYSRAAALRQHDSAVANAQDLAAPVAELPWCDSRPHRWIQERLVCTSWEPRISAGCASRHWTPCWAKYQVTDTLLPSLPSQHCSLAWCYLQSASDRWRFAQIECSLLAAWAAVVMPGNC